MKTTSIRIGMVLSMLGTASWAIAQDAAPPYPQQGPYPQQDQGGWRRLGGPSVGDDADRNQGPPPTYSQQGPPPQYSQQGPPPNYQPNYQQGPPPQYAQQGPLPRQLTIAPGTFIMVRVNQVLSSEHNQPGDPFTASLVKPVVVDGFVVADRGQTVAGRVAEVHKAGHGERTSHLGIELTELTLIDGEQVPLHSQLINRQTNTPVGRDVAAIGTTAALGAAIGAAADYGRGAAIGAVAGAMAGAIGTSLASGRQTVLYPETVLTLRVETPIAISTDRAPQAFRSVGPGDYDQPQDRPRMAARPAPPPYYGGGYYPYYGPYYGYGYGYPYYYGPGITFYGRFGGRRWR
jgi:hypothetical protein